MRFFYDEVFSCFALSYTNFKFTTCRYPPLYLIYSSPPAVFLSRRLLRSAIVITTGVTWNVIQFSVDICSKIHIDTESLAEKMWGIRR